MHKALENELHETVAFTQITTEEEAWALRFLNILFGLRELKHGGKTVSFGQNLMFILARVSCLWIHWKSSCHWHNRSDRI